VNAKLPLIHLPGCKSLSQRALLLAAVAEGVSELRGVSPCEDSVHLQAALSTLGADFQPILASEESSTAQGRELPQAASTAFRVTGLSGPPQGEAQLDVGEAGSSLRFLLPLCAAGRGRFTLTGTPRLIERPHAPLLDCLRELGARIEAYAHPTRPGFVVESEGLPEGDWPVPTALSSQYLSGLAMAASWSGEVRLALPGEVPSRGYFDLTLAALRHFCGADAWEEVASAAGGSLLRLAGYAPQAQAFTVPGDPSGASFFLVALILTGLHARIEPDWSAHHPEARLLSQLLEAGLLERVGTHWMATGYEPGQTLELDIDPAPDAGPALAVLGAHLQHGLRLCGIARLRAKESDRVLGVQRLAELAGRHAQRLDEQLLIEGGGIDSRAAAAKLPFDPDQDHRLAMAAGLVQLVSPAVQVLTPACVAKSFPAFWQEIAKLRAPA
jgi:3-phosphoshikimate 1-carboxyvinyltransferase